MVRAQAKKQAHRAFLAADRFASIYPHQALERAEYYVKLRNDIQAVACLRALVSGGVYVPNKGKKIVKSLLKRLKQEADIRLLIEPKHSP